MSVSKEEAGGGEVSRRRGRVQRDAVVDKNVRRVGMTVTGTL